MKTPTIKPPRLEDVRIHQKPDTVPPGWFTSKVLQAEWNLCESQTRRLIEHAPTRDIFTSPANPQTEAYVSGRFG